MPYAKAYARIEPETATALTRMIYCSHASADFAARIDTDFKPMLEQAQRANKACGVTGGLIYTDGWFVQVLEGPADAVAETFARIQRDPRHTGVEVLVEAPADEREFTDCAMWGYIVPPARRAIAELLAPHDVGEKAVIMPRRALDLIIAARALGEGDDIVFVE